MIVIRNITYIFLIVGIALSCTLVVSAHDGETHADTPTAVMHTRETADIKKLETILALLKQVIALTMELRTHQKVTPTFVPPVSTPAVDDALGEEMEHHHDEHSEASSESTTESTSVPQLVIEVEAHFGKTHVHVRYTDKPEEMFFVDVPLTDEAGIVSGVAVKTGLSEEAVKAALKYL